MCGIAGIYNYRDSQPVDPAQLKQMADVMAHRGPDDEGFFSFGRFSFCFWFRLSFPFSAQSMPDTAVAERAWGWHGEA